MNRSKVARLISGPFFLILALCASHSLADGVEDSDIDQEITNARLRAESGSKSKWSFSSSLAYTGGAISRPFGSDRPNLAGVPGMQVASSLSGTVSGRYRLTKNDSFTLGSAFGVMTPLKGDIGKADRQINIFNPSLGYSRVFATKSSIQNIFDFTVDYGSSNESRSIDYISSPTLGVTSLYSFGNRVTAGLSGIVYHIFYESAPGRNQITVNPNTGRDERTRWGFALYPFGEYAFNEKWQLRTTLSWFNWRNVYGMESAYTFERMFSYQSVGIGYAFSRDIYIYPNIQFVPDNMRSDFTNVAISATINIF